MKTFTLTLICFSILNFVYAQENGGPYTSDDNTVLLMHFDGNANNSAGVGNDGIEHGTGVSYETGVHGQALRLDNSTSDKQSWMEVPFFDELNISEEFSMECWFKINSWGEDQTYYPVLFRKGEAWPADYSAGLGALENTLWAKLNCVNDEYSKGIDIGTYPGVISEGSWYHVSLTFKPQTEPEYWMYMNLLIRDENYKEVFATNGFVNTPPFHSNEKLFIGFGNSGNSYFDGWIDEFRISKKSRKYRDDIISTINTEDFKDSVPPMLRDRWTTYYPPITKYFPIDTITGERYKGNSCGMTIMIRLLHFWEHPRFPSGNIDYWFGPVNWQADLDNTEYFFDLMPNIFGPNSTEDEYAASGIFAQQVSAVTRIYYDNMGTMPQLLTDYFHYKEGMKLYFRNQFTKEEWIKIFKNELSHGRPIMAAGLEEVFDEGGAAGHYYIVDGYNSEGKFHSDESSGGVDFWVDIDSFPYGKFQSIIIGAEPDWHGKNLTINYPKGNEFLLKQTQLEIKWSSENISKLIIEYSSDAGHNWHTIADNVDANTGSYSWTIPDTVSKDYRIRISDKDNLNVYRKSSGINVYDKKEFAFEYPKENTNFKKGTKQPVYWNSTGISAIKLEYSIDGQNWILVSDSISSTNGHTFINLPEILTDNIVLKATDINEPEQTITSEKFSLITDQLWGGPYEKDDNTLLLMHFENNIKNEVNNDLLPYELNPMGIFEENYNKNMGRSFRVYNPDQYTADAIYVENSENLDLGNNWTMETWLKVTSIGGERNVASLIFNKWDVFAISAGWQYFGGFINFENGTNVEFGCPQKYNLNQWYHVAMISDSAQKKICFYVHDENGQIVYQDEKSFPEGSDGMVLKKEFINDGQDKNIVTIGGLGGASNFELDGYLDEVRITKSSKLMDYIETVELPFEDYFEETISQDATFSKWTTQNLEGWHYWHMVTGQGVNYSQCMRFENNDVDQDDWLITRAIDCSGMNQLKVNFDVLYNGNGTKPQLFYKSLNKDDNSTTGWVELNYSLGAEENKWYSINEITINNPGDIIYFAFHSEQKANQGVYFLLDNFRIDGTLTGNKLKPIAQNNFEVYPNPITNESVITFQTKTSGNVNLSVFDIQGRKICTLVNGTLNAGMHTIPISNHLSSSGVYFLKMQTSEGISTLKLIRK